MSTQADTPKSIPDYDPGLFVNREPEIKLITEKVEALSLGEPVHLRTIVFWGYRGSGRTWLLRHLEEMQTTMQSYGVRAFYLDLNKWAEHSDSEQAVEEIRACIAERLREWLDSTVEPPMGDHTPHSEKLKEDVRRLLERHVAVLLVDHVYESDWKLLEHLEEGVLAPAAVESRVLIVMAGRGQAFPWKTPELRLYVQDYHLKPFDRQDYTEEQIKRQKKEAAERAGEIHQVSRGYPLANILLAAQPTIGQAMQEAVNALLYQVPAEECSWMEALCILRTFDEEYIPPLLAAYSEDDSIATLSYRQAREVRDRLIHTRMVRWQEQDGVWIIDEAIRPLLEEYLLQTKPDVWKGLHCAAYRLYAKDWIKLYPDEEERWMKEAKYHERCLIDAGYGLDECGLEEKGVQDG